MSARRSVFYSAIAIAFAVLCFTLGSLTAHQMLARQLAANETRISELRDEMARNILGIRRAEMARVPSGTDGQRLPEVVPASGAQPSALVEEVKRQLQLEMGL